MFNCRISQARLADRSWTRTGSSDRAKKAQSRRFIETAREVEAGEESSAADALLGQLAKQTPEPRKPEK